jgi:hypothetical protein
MKRLGFALILTCVLSVSALAGEIPTIGKASPSPSPTGATQSSGSNVATTILITILSLIR